MRPPQGWLQIPIGVIALAALAGPTSQAPAHAASPVRISQVYGGGGAIGQVPRFSRDYIELYNAGPGPADIGGWALQYGSATGNWGSFPTNSFTFPIGTTLQPCHYLLVGLPGGPQGPPLPLTPDFDSTLPGGPQMNLSASSGKVALFTTLQTNVPCGLETPGALVDKVAYGTANCAEGTPAPGLTINLVALRNGDGNIDTDNNAADFTASATAVPRNSSSPLGCTLLPAPTNLQGQRGCGRITLTWDALSGATDYLVTRSDLVSVIVPLPTYTDSNATAPCYLYTVAGRSGGGLAGNPATSDTLCAVTAAPTGLTISGSLIVPQGGTTTLQVTGSFVTAECAFEWQRDGVPLPGSPDAPSLTLNDVQPAQAGNYACRVCNACGCAASSPVLLAVVPPPPAPQNVTATAGCDSISVGWSLVPGASGYSIYRDGTLLSGAGTVTAPPYVDADPGPGARCYSVSATVLNSLEGAVSAPHCTSAAVSPPTVGIVFPRTTLWEGQWAFLNLTTTGSPTSIAWFHDGQPIVATPYPGQYQIRGAQAADAGTYTATACNPCGCRTSLPLSLVYCPSIKAPAGPGYPRVVNGAAQVSLSWTILNAWSYDWYRYRFAPPYSSFDMLHDGPKYTGTHTPSLTIHDVNNDDEAFYNLVASGPCVQQAWLSCYLRVDPCDSPPTTFTQQPTDQSILLGASATLHAGATGCAPLEYQWLKAGTGGVWGPVGPPGQDYQIANFLPTDAGTYTCRAGTIGGRPAFSDTINVNVEPLRLLNITTSPTACDRAQVRWTLNYPGIAHLEFGPNCGALSQSTPNSPASRSGHQEIQLTGPSQAKFRLVADFGGYHVESDCRTAYFLPASPSLMVTATGSPSPDTLLVPGDAALVRMQVSNKSCRDIGSPVTLVSLALGNAPPRLRSGGVDLPRTVIEYGLQAGAVAPMMLFRFLRSEVGAAPGSLVTLSGQMRYVDGGLTRSVPFSAKVRMP